jgi:hypothetical protein
VNVPLRPGDFACVSMSGAGGALIGFGERLCGDAFSQYQHAFVYVGLKPGRDIVQAEPGGATLAPLGGYDRIIWSSGRIALSAAQRERIVDAALGYAGTPYSWLDYAAIGLRRLRVPAPGLRGYLASTGHMICSQLVDQCYADAGVHLFADGRWPGYVTPADLAARISGAPQEVLVNDAVGQDS